MSWISGLAGKAEDFLNKVDKSAASALQRDKEAERAQKLSMIPSESTINYSPYLSQKSATTPATRPDSLAPPQSNMSYSVSVPANLSKLDTPTNGRSNRRTPASTPGGSGSARQSPTLASKRDKDEELFEFLNSKDTVDSSASASSQNGALKKKSKSLLNGHSRQSSNSSTTSTPTGSKTPEPSVLGVTALGTGNHTPTDKPVNGLPEPGAEQTTNGSTSGDDLHGNHTAAETSSGYISSQEDGASGSPGHLSSLELENRLLKNEVSQLNQEMTAVIQRAREAQDELQRSRRKLDQQTQHLSHLEQVVREVRAQESDLTEALSAKDAQFGVLRVRLEEADKELQRRERTLQQIEDEKNRILNDHTSASGVQSQALDSLKEKLHDAEESLRREQESLRRIQQEAMSRQSVLESEKEHLSQELSSLQKKASDDKAKCCEMAVQLKTAKVQADAAKQELTEYKEKATRILQSKDKLISSLKEGTGSTGSGGDGGVAAAELEDLRQERDLLREELQRAQMSVENLRGEIGELEVQLQQDSDAAQEQISSLEEQYTGERERREDAEQEVNRQKQELRYAHEELIKQKTGFQHRIQDREAEIDRLRSQLTTKNVSTSSQAELENRLHALTESLIQKQTMLESLSTEKNSLVLQLERMERQYREAESSALRASSTSVNMNEEDDVRNRLPLFMRESPLDSNVARRVKRAANSIDRFSMKMGVFLRRYPMARIFVILYMALLHLWVFLVLLTYKPEIHGTDYQPQPPK